MFHAVFACHVALQVATWGYRIDLAQLVHATHCRDEVTAKSILRKMSQADYKLVCLYVVDTKTLSASNYGQLFRHLKLVLLSIPTSCRNASCHQFISQWTMWLPTEMMSAKHSALVMQGAGRLVPGGRRQQHSSDDTLATMILNGCLEANNVIRTLVATLLFKAHREQQGHKRVNATSLPVCDTADINEVAFSLITCSSQGELLNMLGISKAAVPKAPL